MNEHKEKLSRALELHSFNRDIDDLNDRINDKVCIYYNLSIKNASFVNNAIEYYNKNVIQKAVKYLIE